MVADQYEPDSLGGKSDKYGVFLLPAWSAAGSASAGSATVVVHRGAGAASRLAVGGIRCGVSTSGGRCRYGPLPAWCPGGRMCRDAGGAGPVPHCSPGSLSVAPVPPSSPGTSLNRYGTADSSLSSRPALTIAFKVIVAFPWSYSIARAMSPALPPRP